VSLERNDIIPSGLLELYVAGLTTGEETRQVQEWTALYPEVAAELAAIEAAVEAQAMANAVVPNVQIKDKILAAIVQDAQATIPTIGTQGKYVEMTTPQVVGKQRWKWLVAASILLLVGSIGVYIMNNQNRTKGPELTVQPPKLKPPTFQRILADHDSLEKKMRGEADFVKIILKKAPNAAVDCDATIYWNKQSGDLYFDPCHLPNAPAGKQYQLWAMVNGKLVTAGVVITDGAAGKFVVQKMSTFVNAESFAVTLEEKGGKDQPTLEQLFVSGQA
jgi:Anti-sigma-K factor rskA